MKFKKILVATTNKGKILEFKHIFKGLSVVSLEEMPPVQAPKETGETFEKNAKIKSDFYFNHFNLPVIVEDSGFCVKELGGLPGVNSALWGEGGDFTKAIKKVYDELGGKPSFASFVSVIIFKDKEKEIIAKGVVKGKVAKEPKGDGGFGFDPCFIPKGGNKTFAEMGVEAKSLISHRKKAINLLLAKLGG